MTDLRSNNPKMIAVTLWLMLILNGVFLWVEFLPNQLPETANMINSGLEAIRAPLTIVEFLAIGTLFVDLILRFDFIKLHLRALHVIAVGLCVAGFLFKAFIYFLHSAYLS